MTLLRVFILVLLCSASMARAQADEPRPSALPAPETGPATIFSFATDHPDCTEWTNACQVCIRDEKGDPKCSTPGIACTPGALVCRVRKSP